MALLVLWIVLGVLGLFFVVAALILEDECSYDEEVGRQISFAFGLLFLIVPGLFFAGQYSSNLKLEVRVPALTQSIAEQTALIANDATLGSGLEGLQMKEKIQDLIVQKNELIAQGKVRIRSVWWFFKPKPVWERT